MNLLETIRKISFFNSLDEEEIGLISSISTVSKYESNSILFYESTMKSFYEFNDF